MGNRQSQEVAPPPPPPAPLPPPPSPPPPSPPNICEEAWRCCGKKVHPTEYLKQQVFISHTGQDKDATTFAAAILKPALERAGIDVYMDYSDLKLGELWKQELVEAAANSQVVVVVLSKSYTTRFWCMLELDLALNGRPEGSAKPVIMPVLYDNWHEVNSGPGEVIRNNETKKWQGIDAEWSGEELQQWLIDEELGREWRACVDAGRWGTNVRKMNDIQHPRRTSFHGKDGQLKMATDVVAAVVGHVANADNGKYVRIQLPAQNKYIGRPESDDANIKLVGIEKAATWTLEVRPNTGSSLQQVAFRNDDGQYLLMRADTSYRVHCANFAGGDDKWWTVQTASSTPPLSLLDCRLRLKSNKPCMDWEAAFSLVAPFVGRGKAGSNHRWLTLAEGREDMNTDVIVWDKGAHWCISVLGIGHAQ